MRYDPATAPDPQKWLALDETQRIELVSVYHRRTRAKLPDVHLHAIVHVIVENQFAHPHYSVRRAKALCVSQVQVLSGELSGHPIDDKPSAGRQNNVQKRGDVGDYRPFAPSAPP